MCRCAERRAIIKEVWHNPNQVLTLGVKLVNTITADVKDAHKTASSAVDKYLNRRGLR